MVKPSTDEQSRYEVRGEVWALCILANEVRLDCTRNGMPMHAAAIQMMQSALKQINTLEKENK